MTSRNRTHPEERSARNLYQLQILRYFAAIMVAVAHSILLLEQQTGTSMLERAHQLGRTAVAIFFLISGFIIVHTSRHAFGTRSAPRSFLTKRLIRIVPLYTIMSLVAFGVATFGSGSAASCRANEVAYLLASLAFIPVHRCDGVLLPILSQGWTLNYEMVFYAVFAVAMLLSFRGGLAIVTAFFLALALLPSILPEWAASSDLLRFYSDDIVLMFVVGMLVAALYDRTGPVLRSDKPFTLLSLCLIATLAVQESLVVLGNLDRDLLSMIGATVVVGTAVFAVAPGLRLNLADRIVSRLGDASYSIYLVHTFVLTSLKHVWTYLGAWPYGWIPFLFSYLLACSLAGMTIFAFVERPIMDRLRAANARGEAGRGRGEARIEA